MRFCFFCEMKNEFVSYVTFNFPGMNKEEMVRSEVIVLLASRPCTHSLLSEHIPQTHEYSSQSGSKSPNFMQILNKVIKDYTVKKEGMISSYQSECHCILDSRSSYIFKISYQVTQK